MQFNPTRLREVAPESIERLLRSYPDAAGRPIGNYAIGDLQSVIQAWLVGISAEVVEVIPRSLDRLDRAIAGNERFGESINFHQQNLHWAKSMGLWMLKGINIAEDWEKARKRNTAALLDSWPQPGLSPGTFKGVNTVWAKHHVPTMRLDDYMAFCFQAEQYEEGIAEFERYQGDKPFVLNKRFTPKDIGYAWCLHKARGQFEPDEIFEAGRKMLRSKLEETWLGHGQYLRASTWLKVVYWHRNPVMTPLQTILSAYDNMPHVPRPDFI